MQLVIDACKDVPDFCYSIIINKLSKKASQLFQDPQSPSTQDLVACLMEGLPVVTTSFHYMEEIPEIKDEDMNPVSTDPEEQKLRYSLPQDLFRFVSLAPFVFIDSKTVKDVDKDQFQKIEREYKERFDALKGNLEEQKKVNAGLEENMRKAHAQMERLKDQAAQEKHELYMEMQRLEREHSTNLKDLQESFQTQLQKEREKLDEAVTKGEMDRRAAEERIAQMEALQKEERTRALKVMEQRDQENARRLEEMRKDFEQQRKEGSQRMQKLLEKGEMDRQQMRKDMQDMQNQHANELNRAREEMTRANTGNDTFASIAQSVAQVCCAVLPVLPALI